MLGARFSSSSLLSAMEFVPQRENVSESEKLGDEGAASGIF
jgi:hypothetical protein